MARRFAFHFACLLVVAVFNGCSTPLSPRVVRLSFRPAANVFCYSVNGASLACFPVETFTNTIAALRIQGDDILLLSDLAGLSSAATSNCFLWLERLCDVQHTCVYVCPTRGTTARPAMVSAYHWTVASDDPRDLHNAVFYREGKRLGRGKRGFDEMVADIQREAPNCVFILGGTYGVDNSYSPSEAPYWAYQAALDHALGAVGTEQLYPSKLH